MGSNRCIGISMIYFSKSTNGFFFDGINSDMPADIVEICTDLYNELIAGQQEGVN